MEIAPTVGRVVWVRNRFGKTPDAQPEVGLVCYVHSSRNVNVAGFDANGQPFSYTSLRLLQQDEESPDYPHCEWMPFQKGQAAKTEALEKQVGAGG